jgi:hypothetical protein
MPEGEAMSQSRALSWPLLLVTAFSVSIGWGVRGQFGHEYGAALAGALGGMTITLLSGRQDWIARIHYFAFLGAVGFGFGGAMSYMKDVAHIHSSDSATVLYGFGCLFLLGGLWAAPCAAGLGLASWLDRDQLTKLFIALAGIFAAWHFLEFPRRLSRHAVAARSRRYRLARHPACWSWASWCSSAAAIGAMVHW